MPEIGATLREARMRAKIDISEVEAETKIRAKYLRALENEEWDLLPGPTYVRSFLRSYADFMGLDSKLLVEEYRLRHDRTPEHELPPLASAGRQRRMPRGGGRSHGGRSHGPGRMPRGGGPGGGPGRGTFVVLGIVVVIVLVAVVNFAGGGGGGDNEPAHAPIARDSTTTGAAPAPAQQKHRAAAPKKMSLQLLATAPVYVCLQDAKHRLRLAGVTLQPGTKSSTYHSTSFRIRMGNASLTLRVNGHDRTVPPSPQPLGYLVTPHSMQKLPPAKWPPCV